jgi:hypothetical protein
MLIQLIKKNANEVKFKLKQLKQLKQFLRRNLSFDVIAFVII